jgi:hypothetical protein
MNDFTWRPITIGDTVATAKTGYNDLIRGKVVEFGEKMIVIERVGPGYPRKFRRYPEQVIVVEPSFNPVNT